MTVQQEAEIQNVLNNSKITVEEFERIKNDPRAQQVGQVTEWLKRQDIKIQGFNLMLTKTGIIAPTKFQNKRGRKAEDDKIVS